MLQRLAGFLQQLGPPAQQLLAEVFELHRIHEGFFFAGTVIGRQQGFHQLRSRLMRSPKARGVYEFSRRGQVARNPSAGIHPIEFAEHCLRWRGDRAGGMSTRLVWRSVTNWVY